MKPLLPPPVRSHPLGCHRPRISDPLCLRGLFIRLVTGPRGWTSQRSSTTRSLTRPCGPDATSGSQPGCSRSSTTRPSPRSTGSLVSNSTMSPSTGHCTKPPTAVKAPDRTRPTAASAVGSGPSPQTATASRSAGPLTAPTATTSACSSRPSTRSKPPAYTSISRGCTSTAVSSSPACFT